MHTITHSEGRTGLFDDTHTGLGPHRLSEGIKLDVRPQRTRKQGRDFLKTFVQSQGSFVVSTRELICNRRSYRPATSIGHSVAEYCLFHFPGEDSGPRESCNLLSDTFPVYVSSLISAPSESHGPLELDKKTKEEARV